MVTPLSARSGAKPNDPIPHQQRIAPLCAVYVGAQPYQDMRHQVGAVLLRISELPGTLTPWFQSSWRRLKHRGQRTMRDPSSDTVVLLRPMILLRHPHHSQ